jgi:signal transduction histidine kinase
MLHDFLTANRTALIDRCRAKVAARSGPNANRVELEGGIALFLDQLIKTLQVEQTNEPMLSRKVSGPSGGGPALSEIAVTATRHGRELLRQGVAVDQVVHDYGDLCQSITDLAFETDAEIAVDEFRTLNRCLDNAIAGAVTEFGYQHDFLMADKSNQAWSERLGVFAHELRNQLQTATLALRAIKVGNTGLSGATGAVLERSLIGLRTLIDRSLADVRAAAGMPVQNQLISVADLIADVKISASLEAHSRQCELIVAAVDTTLAVDVDRDMLCAAVGNLLQNAFKFTKHGTDVSLNAYAATDRILICVADRCGGLPTGAADVPGSGCIFTIDLPRHSLSKLSTFE